MNTNWNDIIINKSYEHIKDIERGFSNNKKIIKVNNKLYLLCCPKYLDQDLINYANLFEIYSKIQNNNKIVRKCIYGDNVGNFVYEYLEDFNELINKEFNINKLAKIIKIIQKIQINVKVVYWDKVCITYLNKAKKLGFNFDNLILEKITKILESNNWILNDQELVFAHGDFYNPNILVGKLQKTYKIIDFEYCCLTSPYWDIAYYCYYENLKTYECLRLLKLVNKNFKYNQLKKWLQLVNLISICWSAQDYCKTNNIESLKQYKIAVKKIMKEV